MKICFWGNVAGALTGKTTGGGELQIAFIARALAAAGHEVVIVDYSIKEEFTTPDEIKVFPIKRWHQGPRVLRTLTHRLPGLHATLLEQNADVYYCRIRDFRHIIPFRVSRKLRSKFVLHMAADLDATGFKERLKNFYFDKPATLWWFFSGMLIEFTYPYLLKNADLVLVQHAGQKEILARRNIESEIFYNIIDMTDIPDFHNSVREDFIYVGWLDKRKGFPDFFDIVERSPQHTFKIVGPPRDKVAEGLVEKLKTFPNVKLSGKLSHRRTIMEIANSKALISTSPMEGFPNVFIEAWACGIPVYSLKVDPGSVIEKEGLGVMAHGNPEVIIKAMDNHRNSLEFAEKARTYIETHHSMNPRKVEEVNRIFTEIKYGKERIFKEAVL